MAVVLADIMLRVRSPELQRSGLFGGATHSLTHPEEAVPMTGQQSIRLGLILAVQGVQSELVLLKEI